MKKYILISLAIHLFFIFGFGFMQLNDFENEKLNPVVPITFVAKNVSANPGSNVLADKEHEEQAEKPKPKNQEIKKVEENKEPKKIEKEIESNISNKNAKDMKHEENTTSQPASTNENSGASSTGSGSGSSDSNGGFGSNFISDGDGGYIALSSKGINYQILNEVEPDYPEQAENIGYSQKVTVTVKFLVGLKGNIEKTEIVKSHKDLGFDAEVMKAIRKWRFKPIYHNGKNIKVYFVKDFVFNPR